MQVVKDLAVLDAVPLCFDFMVLGLLPEPGCSDLHDGSLNKTLEGVPSSRLRAFLTRDDGLGFRV